MTLLHITQSSYSLRKFSHLASLAKSLDSHHLLALTLEVVDPLARVSSGLGHHPGMVGLVTLDLVLEVLGSMVVK